MKKIGLYGYGVFGKRASESFRSYWGGEYRVTAIFDRDPAGQKDRYWGLSVLSPGRMKEEYGKGTFEAVMICIYDREARSSVSRQITDLGIPLFVPGSPEDFAEPEYFPQEDKPEITVCRKHYAFHVYKNMLGAVADCERLQILFFFDETGRVCIDNYKKYIHDYEENLLQYPFRLRDPIPEKIFMKGSYCALTKAYSFNYGHFTFEMADCVYLLEKAGYRGKYIFNDRPYTRELLQVMGVSPDRLIGTKELEIHKVYVFERLYDINHAGLGQMEYSREVLPEMADCVKKKLKRRKNSPGKIYVKRTGIRKLMNGEEVAEKNGFCVIVPEQYSVLEQMELFYNADIVLCPHGANSTNYLYMHKGAVFAEIFSDRWHMDINADICEANGVHYLQMTGTACTDSGVGKDADYTADEEALQQLILQAERSLALS